jgi:hypothetical protein
MAAVRRILEIMTQVQKGAARYTLCLAFESRRCRTRA